MPEGIVQWDNEWEVWVFEIVYLTSYNTLAKKWFVFPSTEIRFYFHMILMDVTMMYNGKTFDTH